MKKYNSIIEYISDRYNSLTKDNLKDIFIETLATFYEDYGKNDNTAQYRKILKEVSEEVIKRG